MFIPELSFRNPPEPDELSDFLSAEIFPGTIAALAPVSCFLDDLGGRKGYRHPLSAAKMDALVSTRQPWRSCSRHLEFEYSDLRANYPTHDMLILTLPYAVKTSRPQFIHRWVSPTFPNRKVPLWQRTSSKYKIKENLHFAC